MRVVLDKWEVAQSDRVDVPKLVSTLGRCNVAIPVITPAFNEAVTLSQRDPGWVFYEFRTACLLSWHGRLRVHGVLRAGASTPDPWFHWPTLDLTSEPEELAERVLAHFGYRGPVVERDSVAERVWQESWKLLVAELYDDAERTLQQAVARFPRVLTFWSHLAFCRIQQHKGAEADSALLAASALDDNDLFTLGLMAERSYAKRDVSGARALCRSILRRAPFDSAAHFLLGNILDDERLFAQATGHLNIALARRPTAPSILNNAGCVRLHMHDYAEAIRLFDRVSEGSSLYPLAQLNKADALRLSGDLDGSKSVCEALLTRHPNFEQARKLQRYLSRYSPKE